MYCLSCEKESLEQLGMKTGETWGVVWFKNGGRKWWWIMIWCLQKKRGYGYKVEQNN